MKAIFRAWAGPLALAAVSSLAHATGPTDPQIAAIVVTANQVDIDAGSLAKSTAQAPAVRDFAARMITDHSGVNDAARSLVRKLDVTPQDSDTSRALKRDGDENLASLKKLHGGAFDRAYLDHEIAYHRQVLDAMDSTLIPGAKNEALKGLLEKVRPAFSAHLEHARHLRSSLPD